jgi:5-methylcytosine-specific restriction endonuclease McrA
VKTCTRCNEAKPLAEFYRTRQNRDGRTYWCKGCRAAYRREQYTANLEKARAERREWKAANPEKKRAYSAAHYRRDQTYYKEWYAKNREKKIAASREYRKRTGRRGRPDWLKTALRLGQCTKEQLEWKVAYYGWKCVYCGGPYETIDHVIPLSRGGTSHPVNLVPACRACNYAKHAKTLKEWATGVIPYRPLPGNRGYSRTPRRTP